MPFIALAGGYAANRISRGYLYLYAGLAASLFAIALAFTPHTATTFIVGVLVYNGIAGVVYAAFNALGYQLVGQKSSVASASSLRSALAMSVVWVNADIPWSCHHVIPGQKIL